MFKFLPLLILLFVVPLIGPCDKKKPDPPKPAASPSPTVQPTPSVQPTPEPSPSATPSPSLTLESASNTRIPQAEKIIDSNGDVWTLKVPELFRNGVAT